jgi:Flp pilus assembly protein protease CpaA
MVSLQGALVGAGAVLLIGELSELAVGQEAMGGGDCALMGMIGAFLGWEAIIPVLLLGSVISTVIFLLTAIWLRRDGGTEGALGVEESGRAEPIPARSFRWGMVVRLMALGSVPILLLASSLALGIIGQVLSAVFHGVIGAGVAYYASFLLPASLENQSWPRVRGLLAAAVAIAIGAGVSVPRILVALALAGAAMWYARRVPLMPSPETHAGLQSQGYLPFGVGLTAAAAVLQFSGSMPLVRDAAAQYARLLRFM